MGKIYGVRITQTGYFSHLSSTIATKKKKKNQSCHCICFYFKGSLLSFWLVPERIRGISMHFLTLFNGAGCFMGAFFVQTAHTGTQGKNMPMTGVLEQFF